MSAQQLLPGSKAVRRSVPLPGAISLCAVTGEAKSQGNTCQPARQPVLTGWCVNSISSPELADGAGGIAPTPRIEAVRDEM